MGFNHCLDQYTAEITALFAPYLVLDISEAQWMRLQLNLNSKLTRMYEETHNAKNRHAVKK